MGCYDATVTPWNITILKNHHCKLQYQKTYHGMLRCHSNTMEYYHT